MLDVLYSDRAYRKAFGFDRSIEMLLEMTESHFDRRLIELFLPIAEEVRTNG